MDEHICPLCGQPMSDCSKPQRPRWFCFNCNCDDSGLEIDFCESCGEPYTCGDDKDCLCIECDEE